MSAKKGSSIQKQTEPCRDIVEEPVHGAVEMKGERTIGKSVLCYHDGLDTWSVYFILPGKVPTWVAMPNEKIARGAYEAGPPYEVDSISVGK